jgi:DNA primase
MAGRIKSEDIALVREKTAIDDVIGEHVQLRSAGGGNLKGICPFHDEKSPSFNVTPSRGMYYCFGCGAGGDVIKFVQEVEGLDFTDAVERLAARANITLRYEEGFTPGPSRNAGQRSRLIAAHQDAAAFYAEQLRTPEAQTAREFLAGRGFDEAAAVLFGCGYAPSGWDALTQHLLKKGYTEAELTIGGLSKRSERGNLNDRFHRRLLWPIKDVSGDVVGFGARRLFDDDRIEAKYLNTSETPIFKKGETLFGIHLARRDIAKQHRAVIVEGYTDVMACHLAGVTTAVATNGTAFGDEHVKLLRRLLLDSDTERGEVIFTFDGDNAGMKAAERAFTHDQKFMANTFVAVAANGMDPCELRMHSGDKSVLDLVASRLPLVEFVLRMTVAKFDLDTAEGRVAALDRGIPYVAQIKDRSLRDEYARRLAGLVGFGLEDQVLQRVRGLEKANDKRAAGGPAADATAPAGPAVPKLDEGVVHVEREVLKVALQFPEIAGPQFDYLADEAFTHPGHQAVRRAVAAAGGTEAAARAGLTGPGWADAVAEHLDPALRGGMTRLAVEPLKAPEAGWQRYGDSMLARLHEIVASRHVADLKGKLQRINPQENAREYDRLFGELVALEAYRRDLRERAIGGAV